MIEKEDKNAREMAEHEARVKTNNFEMQMRDYFENNPTNSFQMMISQILEQSLAKSNQQIVGGVANQLDETNHQIKILHERMNNLEDDIISKKSQHSHSSLSKHSKELSNKPPNLPSPLCNMHKLPLLYE